MDSNKAGMKASRAGSSEVGTESADAVSVGKRKYEPPRCHRLTVGRNTDSKSPIYPTESYGGFSSIGS
jgi:hypothetical protein